MQQQWFLADEQATNDWAAGLAAVLPRDFFFIALRGDLGAGKTHTVRAVLRALGEQGPVRSPTYTLMEDYRWSDRHILHLDLYRLAEPSELEYLGLRELIGQPLQMLVEWPDRGDTALPAADMDISLSINPLGGRDVSVAGRSLAGQRCLQAWSQKSSSKAS